MMPVLVIMLFLVIGYAELKPLVKSGDIKGFWISGILLLLSFVILMLKSFGIEVPSPIKPVITLIKSLFEKS